MTRAEDYLRRAAEAEDRAEKTSDSSLERQLREAAANWRDLARWAGHHPAETPDGDGPA